MEKQDTRKAVFYYHKGTSPDKSLLDSYTKLANDYGIQALILEECEFRYPDFINSAFKIFEEKEDSHDIINSENGKSFQISHNHKLKPNGDRVELLLSAKSNSDRFTVTVAIANVYADGRSWEHTPENLFSFMLDCGLIVVKKKLGLNDFSDNEVNLTGLISGAGHHMTPEEIIRFLAT